MNIKLLSIFLLSTLISSAVFSKENRGDAREQVEPIGYLYGLGIGLNQEIYKGYDYRFIPLPILGYRGENFRVLGPFVSYDAVEFSDIEIRLQAAPRFQGFDDSDSYIFENMADRKFSMDAGIGLTYEKKDWKIGLSSMFDVLGRSKGFEAKTNLSRVFRKGPIFFEPSISVSYLDDNHVDYYYGVKENEVNSNTYQYQGTSAINTTIGFSVATPILLGGFTQIALDYTWYDSSITDSPLVEDKTNLSARLLFSKFF
jgi:outer membrane protein